MRITLAEKLRKSNEFEKYARIVRNTPKPVKYIQSEFDVSYATAKKFVDEVNGFSPVLKKDLVSDNKYCDIARVFLEDFERGMFESPDTHTLIVFGERLDKLDQKILVEIFKLLTNKTPFQHAAIDMSQNLVIAIKYLLQKKTYKQVFLQDMPESIVNRTNTLVEKCL